MISTTQLQKNFGKNIAVDKLNLEVPSGQVFGFLGPNGAGKTTTVRMLTSLIAPTAGTAWVNGFQVGKQDEAIRRTVGVLTESPGLYDHLSAEENLLLYARLYEVEKPQQAVEKYLRMLALWERRFEKASTFSKGMKQKLAIARALLHEPKTIFLDEPTSGLDPSASRLVRDFIAELRNLGRTIFICTHNLDEAERLCDVVGVFKQKILVQDSPSALRKQLFGRQVVFHLKQMLPALAETLGQQFNLPAVEILDNKLIVTVADPENENPAIVRALVELGAEVQFVGEIRHSLEDVYLRLLGN
ncbi:MAG TPA: ABC transporter ATP-binding protein [Anaerolineales bacterium]|nr:ABC transporter ATP-binding protein [Anaerolineales bacterium]